MYKEIHPLWYDANLEMNDARTKTKRDAKEYFQPCSPRVIDLSTIRQVLVSHSNDNKLELTRLVISQDYHDDLLVSKEEGEEIKKLLLRPGDDIAGELARLTRAVFELKELLRARMP